MGTVIRIDPHALYSRADLDEMLRPMGIDVDGWIAKVRPVRRFRLAYWGGDLIRAIETTPALGVEESVIDGRARGRGNVVGENVVRDARKPSAKEPGAPNRRARATDLERALAPLERLMKGSPGRA